MKERAYKLMKEWCDTLLSHQVKTATPYTNNALLCPACHVIHGRIADLCFPLTVLWARTGDKAYLEQADRLIDWTEYNLKTSDGLWFNDAGTRWIGTSTFSAMSIGDALYHFGDVLPKEYKDKWMAILVRMSDVILTLDSRADFRPVTNYYCGIAAALALAWRLTGNAAYYEKTKYWIDKVLSRMDGDGLIYGEGYPLTAADGTHTVDLGYNLEESLPLLLRYSALTGEHTELARTSLRQHLEFLLPDGAIDNSFGTRHNKWTYWGSRTSDGLIEGLALVLDEPIFADACERVLTAYEQSTHEGLLAMPMAHEAGEPTCLHHTFTHAHALAALVCAEHVPTPTRTTLPAEQPYGVKAFQNGRLLLFSDGAFRATVSAIGATLLGDKAANGGGSLNLLYHKDYGVICAATTAEYVPSEPYNQQYLRHADRTVCMTAQFVIDGRMACLDKDVELSAESNAITASTARWQVRYTFNGRACDLTLSTACGTYNLPVVCKKDSAVTLSDDRRTVQIDQALRIRSDAPLTCDPNARAFHQVGGFLYLPISLNVHNKARVTIEVL
ncbi:MAG: hypothetical protein IJW29_09795 [Clostridia bacterium]|nr:hypothetical protein [Clostridia bacterium]MBQ9785781.1 hypothetical protein [Clostridia bacterium]